MDRDEANYMRINEILSYVFPSGILRVSNDPVDQTRPLWEEDTWESLIEDAKENYLGVLRESLIILAKYDFFLRDVEVYLQHNGTMVICNLAKVHHQRPRDGLRVESAKILPVSIISKGFLQ
jgi:hypothetical protein